jgi:hypothetical protein
MAVAFGILLSACKSPAQRVRERNALQDEMDKAIEQVKEIVNQPVDQLRQTESMDVAMYKPGWFHKGANKPDFSHVDIRRTQEKSYAKHEYVTSDLNPGIVFRGADIEFNSNTKYFYDDYSLPKKMLTDEEMEEITRLYRIIGRCEAELAKL